MAERHCRKSKPKGKGVTQNGSQAIYRYSLTVHILSSAGVQLGCIAGHL
jgi:hypothetical protein